MREVVEGMDLCGVPLVGLALHAAAAAAARHAPRFKNGMGYAAVLVLLIVLGWGFSAVGIFEARSVLAVGVLAWVAATSSALAALLIQPVLFAFWDGWTQAVAGHRAEIAKWKAREAAERAARLPPPPLPPPPPPPPTTDERAEQRRKAFEENCRRIDESALPDDEKTALKNAQLDEYERDLRKLLG